LWGANDGQQVGETKENKRWGVIQGKMEGDNFFQLMRGIKRKFKKKKRASLLEAQTLSPKPKTKGKLNIHRTKKRTKGVLMRKKSEEGKKHLWETRRGFHLQRCHTGWKVASLAGENAVLLKKRRRGG